MVSTQKKTYETLKQKKVDRLNNLEKLGEKLSRKKEAEKALQATVTVTLSEKSAENEKNAAQAEEYSLSSSHENSASVVEDWSFYGAHHKKSMSQVKERSKQPDVFERLSDYSRMVKKEKRFTKSTRSPWR
ncbi:unnamed protein product [Ambrosiozyma monospora]|uniref:Unnamed protein product n=1 Tax=Ambrosiozyma monospora TaxID=43982 RepID=A0ACB5SVB9_AMBMO|nr:unnamed protein product [Ambrosiozyma monospora]